MKITYRAEFADSPTLGDLLEQLTKMHDNGASLAAEIVLTLGDKGTQRDPWTYLRGISVTSDDQGATQ